LAINDIIDCIRQQSLRLLAEPLTGLSIALAKRALGANRMA
jgi:hypothetical protein